MSMYYCHYTFEANSCPKFMREALSLLTDAKGKVFLDSNDVGILGFKVRKALEAAKPKGSTAHVSWCEFSPEVIGFDIYKNDNSDTSVGRAYFASVLGFTTYDMDKEALIDVKLKMEEKL